MKQFCMSALKPFLALSLALSVLTTGAFAFGPRETYDRLEAPGYASWYKVLLDDDFTDFTATEQSPGTPAGYWGSSVHYGQVVDSAHGTSVRIVRASSQSNWLGTAQYDFTKGYETHSAVQIEVEMYLESKVTLTMAPRDTTPTSAGNLIAFSSTGTLTIPNFTNQTNMDRYKNYATGCWYRFLVYIDIDKATFDLSINGDEIAKGAALPTIINNFYHIRFINSTASTEGTYLDNLKVTLYGRSVNTIKADDFSNYGATYATPAIPAGWRGSLNGKNVYAENTGARGTSLKFHSEATGGDAPWFGTPLMAQTGRVHFSMEYMPSLRNQRMAVIFYPITGSSKTLLLFHENGTLQVLDSETDALKTVGQYTLEEWHRIEITIDIDLDTYGVFLDGAPLAEEAALPAAFDALREIRMFYYNWNSVSTNGPTAGYFDNIKVAKLSNVHSAIAAPGLLTGQTQEIDLSGLPAAVDVSFTPNTLQGSDTLARVQADDGGTNWGEAVLGLDGGSLTMTVNGVSSALATGLLEQKKYDLTLIMAATGGSVTVQPVLGGIALSQPVTVAAGSQADLTLKTDSASFAISEAALYRIRDHYFGFSQAGLQRGHQPLTDATPGSVLSGVSITNFGGADVDYGATVYVALYRKDGDALTLHSVKTASTLAANGAVSSAAGEVTIPDGDSAYVVKTFVWNPAKGLVPITDPISLP